MPTTFTHTFFAVAAGGAISRRRMPARFWILLAICAVLPDLDVIGLRLGVPYDSVFGHRGLMHSLPFAAALSIAAVLLGFREPPLFSRKWWALLGCLFVVCASHGLLDAMTNGGLGVALFSPFAEARYFLPWRPIQVSPIGIRNSLTVWGIRTILSEILWIWIPMSLLWLAARRMSGVRTRKSAAGNSDRTTDESSAGKRV